MEELFEKRYSPRAFSEKEISLENIHKILNAGRLAPSAYNAQPWHFIIATKNETEKYNKIVETMVEFNQQWASNAPLLIVAVADKKFSHNKKDYSHSWYDLGQAVAYMTIQAMDLGIYSHQMSGFSAEQIKDKFKINEDMDVVTIVTFGYLGDVSVLPESLQKIEVKRPRKKLEEIIINV